MSSRTAYRYRRCGRIPGTRYELAIFTVSSGEYWFRIDHQDRHDHISGHLVDSPEEAESDGRRVAIRRAIELGEYLSYETLFYRYVAGFLVKVDRSIEGLWHLNDGGGNEAQHVLAFLRIVSPDGEVFFNLIIGTIIFRLAWIGALGRLDSWWSKPGSKR